MAKPINEAYIYLAKSIVDNIEQVDLQHFLYKIAIAFRERYGCNSNVESGNAVIQTPNNKELICIPSHLFISSIEHLLAHTNTKGTAQMKGCIYKDIEKIRCHTPKAKSSDKTDIHIILHDCRTKINSEMGYSIKSQLGGDSTLLNASKATNLTFRIEGKDFSDSEINEINALNPAKKKVIRRVEEIKNKGGKLIFDKVDNDVFRRNLLMLDCCMPQVVASLLLEQLATGEPMLKELAKVLKEKDPLGISGGHDASFYEYKIKHLLTSAALGMMPATVWDGKFDANGGYIVVKKDGDVLCYHFYDRNRFEDYLFYNVSSA